MLDIFARMAEDRVAAQRMLLLKTPKETGHDPYVQVLTAHGYAAECVGVLGFKLVNLDLLRERLIGHQHYSCVLLTSQRSVEAIAEAMKDSQDTSWRELPAYVVGKATHKLAEKLGMCNIKGSDSGNAENLGNILLSDLSRSDKHILFPCGNLRKETLPDILSKNGIGFEDITVYETSADSSIKENLMNYLNKGDPDLVVFYSPSGVQFTSQLWEELGISKSLLKCVAIGPSTQQSLQQNGFFVAATASHPTPESVLAAISEIKL